jgi:protocatechuate 3,4-dioxygenase beta subunit
LTLAKLVTAAKSKIAIAATVGVVAAGALLWHHLSQNANSTAGSIPALASVAAPTVANDNAQSQQIASGTTNAATAASPPQMLFHLVDADTGEALPGAKLHLFYLFQDGRGKTVHSTTDRKGQAEIDIPQPPYRGLNFFVTAADHVPMVTSWGFGRSMPTNYTMKVKRGVSIGGTVVDESGKPIAGAKIEFDSGGNNMSLAENIQFTGDAAVKTDANGKWTSDMIPANLQEISLIVTEKEHAETLATVHPASPDANNLSITMPAGFSVKGIVENSKGDPIPGAKVRQVRLNEEREQVKTTDSSGAFDFPAMAAGELTLAVTADGFAPGVQTIDVTNSTAPLKFQLGLAEILRGRIVDEQGNPVAHAFIETTRRGLDKIQWSTRTDSDGRFQWNSAPEEPLLYSVLAEGFDRVYSHSLTADGSEQVIKLTRENPDKDTVKIAGTVTDIDSGEPLSSFKVFVKEADADFTFPPMFFTDGQNGKFAISLSSKSPHPGYVIQVEQGGYLPAESDHLQLTNGNQALVFNLHKGSGPSGIVLLPGGEPAVDATVLLCTPQAGVRLDSGARVQKGLNTTTYTTQTDSNGHFLLPPAIDPEGVSIVHPQGFAQLSMSQLPSDGTITLQPWGTVKGTLSIDSQPAPNQTVSIYNQEVHYSSEGRALPFLTFSSSATTDTKGGFVFDKVPPGEWHVFELQAARVNAYETTVTVKSGSVTEVALGAAGRTLIGKAVQPLGTEAPDWQNVTARLFSKTDGILGAWPQRTNFATADAFIAAQKAFRQAQANEKNFGVNLQSDGSFSLRGIPAGTYQLKIELRDSKRNSAVPHSFSDPSPVVASIVKDVTIPDDSSADPIDLRTLELVPQSGNLSTR